MHMTYMRLPRWLSGKESAYKAGSIRDAGSISGSGRSLEEGMATHSSILAWRIPWTEEPGGLQSMGSQNQTQLSTSTKHNMTYYIYDSVSEESRDPPGASRRVFQGRVPETATFEDA